MELEIIAFVASVPIPIPIAMPMFQYPKVYKWPYLPDKKRKKKYSNSYENMFFWRKTDKTIWKPPFPRQLPSPHPLSTNPPISEQFFMTRLFVQIFKNKKLHPNFRGKETMPSKWPNTLKQFVGSCRDHSTILQLPCSNMIEKLTENALKILLFQLWDFT